MSDYVASQPVSTTVPPHMDLPIRQIDQRALTFNQSMIIAILAIAFLLDTSWLVAFVAAVMAIGTIWPAAGLFKMIYSHLLRPLHLLQPQLIADDPRPHLFAQGVGAMVLLAAMALFTTGMPIAAWILVGLVVLLAAINLIFAFCVGCFLYFQLAQWGIRPSLAQWD
ncbi:MAG: DUF4395 domain-containing protein, partial [Caldilineaceae bacterium]|nr:DUF4395 domain-containing protein [Caldilineaceae bacterium]